MWGVSVQVIRSFKAENATPVGFGVRTMLLTNQNEDGPIASRLGGLGSKVEAARELFAALEALIEDPAGYGLFVRDCDGFGGVDAGIKAVAMLGGLARRIPVILVSAGFSTQTFPEDRGEPTCLRAPISVVSLRVGFEHALRDRLALRIG